MGIEGENDPHIVKTALVVTCSNKQSFTNHLTNSHNNNCDLLLSNLFTPQDLTQAQYNQTTQQPTQTKEQARLNMNQLELDTCFVPCDQSFSRSQLQPLCPLLPNQLLADEQNVSRAKFFVEYCVYLGVKRLHFKFQCSPPSILTLQQLSPILIKTKMELMVMVNTGSGSQQCQRVWNQFVAFRRSLPQLSLKVCLRIGQNLPEKWIVDRWLGQRLSYVGVDQGCFVINNKGFPVLSKGHQSLISSLIKKHCHLMLQMKESSPSQHIRAYWQYFSFLVGRIEKQMSKRQIQAKTLLDYLQSPLQPYIDNLDAQVYDIFEQDTLKYTLYEQALTEAFLGFDVQRVINVYYVGPGKGKILPRIMSACKEAKRKVKVICVQKNPFPLQTLKRRIAKNRWGKFVEVVKADIRDYEMPVAPDVIVSQLLGGLGDNQLSPECLRWAEKNCTPSTILIPQKYTAFIRPLSTHTLHKQLSPAQKQSYFTVNLGLSHSPFDSKPVWAFSHPLDKQESLQREASVEWVAPYDVAIHGFEGTFDCNLYGKAYFSIVAETCNKQFYSWFPLYFPFQQEIVVAKGQRMAIDFKRKVSASSVWYQWRYRIGKQEGQEEQTSMWHNELGTTAILLSQ